MKKYVLNAVAATWLLLLCSTAPAQSEKPDAAAAVPDDGVYRLGPGDKLRITVFNEARLTGEYGITPAGNVSFPMLGVVPAKGVTTEGLQKALHDGLASGGFVTDALVSVEVVNYRPYYILGEVNKPGEYPYAVGLRLQQAIAAAGGYTYRANHRAVFLLRASSANEQKMKLRSGAPYVMPGDTIRIGERYF